MEEPLRQRRAARLLQGRGSEADGPGTETAASMARASTAAEGRKASLAGQWKKERRPSTKEEPGSGAGMSRAREGEERRGRGGSGEGENRSGPTGSAAAASEGRRMGAAKTEETGHRDRHSSENSMVRVSRGGVVLGV